MQLGHREPAPHGETISRLRPRSAMSREGPLLRLLDRVRRRHVDQGTRSREAGPTSSAGGATCSGSPRTSSGSDSRTPLGAAHRRGGCGSPRRTASRRSRRTPDGPVGNVDIVSPRRCESCLFAPGRGGAQDSAAASSGGFAPYRHARRPLAQGPTGSPMGKHLGHRQSLNRQTDVSRSLCTNSECRHEEQKVFRLAARPTSRTADRSGLRMTQLP